VETGSLTAIVTIICIITMVLKNHINYDTVYVGVIGKLYANSVVVLINSRLKLGGERDDEVTEVYFSTMQIPQTRPEDGGMLPGDSGMVFEKHHEVQMSLASSTSSIVQARENESL